MENPTQEYELTVQATGYDTYKMRVPADSLTRAKKREREALAAWAERNDVNFSSTGLAQVTYARIKHTPKG